MTFYSIPGTNYDNTRSRGGILSDLNPNFKEYYEHRDEHDNKATGMDVGEKCNIHGVKAEIMHEEYDQHTNTVKQIVRTDSQSGSGTREVEWSPIDRGKMRVTRIRRIFE